MKLFEKLSENHNIVKGIKFIPIVSTMMLTVHIALLLLGISEIISVGISSFLLVVLLVLLSIKFHFCILHKCLVAYLGLVNLCICIRKLDGFGVMLDGIRVLLLVSGIVLSIFTIKNICENGRDDY